MAAVKNGSFDLFMIGDSITHTLGEGGADYAGLSAVWKRHLEPRHAINLGFSGYRTENILWNLSNGQLDTRHPPKVVTLLIGTNNTDNQFYPSTHSAEELFAGTKAIVGLIRSRLPSSKVLIIRPFPCGGPDDHPNPGHKGRVYRRSAACLDALRRAGEMSRSLADGSHVFWVDAGHVFLRPDGTINPDLMPDLIHPNAAGAEAWVQAIEPTLSQLMGDKPIVDPPATSSTQPAPRSDGSYDWNARHQAVLKAADTQPKIVFIGDSITHYIGGTPATPEGPFSHPKGKEFQAAVEQAVGGPMINLGFGADWTQHVLWRIDHGELDGISPRHVVLMIGTNNILSGDGKVEDVVAGVKACMIRIRNKTPHAKLIVMGVLPCRNSASHPNRVTAAKVNEGLKALAAEAKCDFLDIGASFVDAQGNIPPSLMEDAVHPTAAGYRIWQEALLPVLKDNRESPSK